MTTRSALRFVLYLPIAVFLFCATSAPALLGRPATIFAPAAGGNEWCYGNTGGFAEVVTVMLGCGSCLGIFLLAMMLPIIASLLIAFWMAYDAKRRGDPNFVLWGLLGLMLNIFGLLIYLIARPAAPYGTPTTAAATQPVDPPGNETINPT